MKEKYVIFEDGEYYYENDKMSGFTDKINNAKLFDSIRQCKNFIVKSKPHFDNRILVINTVVMFESNGKSSKNS